MLCLDLYSTQRVEANKEKIILLAFIYQASASLCPGSNSTTQSRDQSIEHEVNFRETYPFL